MNNSILKLTILTVLISGIQVWSQEIDIDKFKGMKRRSVGQAGKIGRILHLFLETEIPYRRFRNGSLFSTWKIK